MFNLELRLRALLILSLLVLSTALSRAATWLPFGPFGGDARAFAVDPQDHAHLYLGTTNGWIYESHNGGQLWQRLAQLGKRDDLVLDHILVDRANSKHLVVGVWVLGSPDGGIYSSHDGGVSWAEDAAIKGQSVRSLTVAPSDGKVIVAGTLKGIFRSRDAGEHWTLISPEGSTEIHEVESVAFDPASPETIYAGTWHLPWKTTDGGEHWSSIKQGIIDDSDVFSIIVDPMNPKTVYASACSGIYKSDTGGDQFQKVQGIPSTARRTRVLKQDLQTLSTVFAGTTEGLFKTVDAGKTWSRTTGPEVIVNDVFIDPGNSQHVLLATDRGGVLTSDDAGVSFRASNDGFTARQVVGYTVDRQHPGTMYVGVINDKEWGGVFVSETGGLRWVQQSTGLGGRDVFSLAQASDGTIIAGTGHGLYRLETTGWTRASVAEVTAPSETPRVSKQRRGEKPSPVGDHIAAGRSAARSQRSTKPGGVNTAADPAIYSLAVGGDTLYAAGSLGLLRSETAGTTWTRVAGVQDPQVLVAAAGANVTAATLHAIKRSGDAGATWTDLSLPPGLTQVAAVAVDASGSVWVGGREGLFYAMPDGSWHMPEKLFTRDVNSLYFDPVAQRVLITANQYTHLVFAVDLKDRSVTSWDTGWHLRFVQPVGDYFVGATLFDGIVIQPKMVDSPLAGGGMTR